MSSVPIKIKQLGLKESRRPEPENYKGSKTKQGHFIHPDNWGGTVKGKTKHTYKNGD